MAGDATGADLVEVGGNEHRLRADQVLAGEARQLGERGDDQRAPGCPVLEVARLVVGQVLAQQRAYGLRVEHPGARDQRGKLAGPGRLSCARTFRSAR